MLNPLTFALVTAATLALSWFGGDVLKIRLESRTRHFHHAFWTFAFIIAAVFITPSLASGLLGVACGLQLSELKLEATKLSSHTMRG